MIMHMHQCSHQFLKLAHALIDRESRRLIVETISRAKAEAFVLEMAKSNPLTKIGELNL